MRICLPAGKNVDNPSRNVIGVSDRGHSMKTAFFGAENSSTHVREVFCKVVEIYCQNPEKR